MNDTENDNEEHRQGDEPTGQVTSSPMLSDVGGKTLVLAGDSEPSVDWRMYLPEIHELCDLKAEEFRILGYKDVTGDEIWECVRQTNRKATALHELVAGVLGLQTSKFMNFTTVNAYKGVFSSSKFPSE